MPPITCTCIFTLHITQPSECTCTFSYFFSPTTCMCMYIVYHCMFLAIHTYIYIEHISHHFHVYSKLVYLPHQAHVHLHLISHYSHVHLHSLSTCIHYSPVHLHLIYINQLIPEYIYSIYPTIHTSTFTTFNEIPYHSHVPVLFISRQTCSVPPCKCIYLV